MKIEYDEIADAMYIRYSNNKISFTKDNGKIGEIVDFDESGKVVGMEIIGVRNIFRQNNIEIKQLEKQLEYC